MSNINLAIDTYSDEYYENIKNNLTEENLHYIFEYYIVNIKRLYLLSKGREDIILTKYALNEMKNAIEDVNPLFFKAIKKCGYEIDEIIDLIYNTKIHKLVNR